MDYYKAWVNNKSVDDAFCEGGKIGPDIFIYAVRHPCQIFLKHICISFYTKTVVK